MLEISRKTDVGKIFRIKDPYEYGKMISALLVDDGSGKNTYVDLTAISKEPMLLYHADEKSPTRVRFTTYSCLCLAIALSIPIMILSYHLNHQSLLSQFILTSFIPGFFAYVGDKISARLIAREIMNLTQNQTTRSRLAETGLLFTQNR